MFFVFFYAKAPGGSTWPQVGNRHLSPSDISQRKSSKKNGLGKCYFKDVQGINEAFLWIKASKLIRINNILGVIVDHILLLVFVIVRLLGVFLLVFVVSSPPRSILSTYSRRMHASATSHISRFCLCVLFFISLNSFHFFTKVPGSALSSSSCFML